MESEEDVVARLRAAESTLNEEIRNAARFGLVVEVSTVEVSMMLDRPAQSIVEIRIMREL
jgi:hypothetical protein